MASLRCTIIIPTSSSTDSELLEWLCDVPGVFCLCIHQDVRRVHIKKIGATKCVIRRLIRNIIIEP